MHRSFVDNNSKVNYPVSQPGLLLVDSLVSSSSTSGMQVIGSNEVNNRISYAISTLPIPPTLPYVSMTEYDQSYSAWGGPEVTVFMTNSDPVNAHDIELSFMCVVYSDDVGAFFPEQVNIYPIGGGSLLAFFILKNSPAYPYPYADLPLCSMTCSYITNVLPSGNIGCLFEADNALGSGTVTCKWFYSIKVLS